MSAEFASLLVVQIITFLTTILTMVATSRKQSSERADAAKATEKALEQARADLREKNKLDDERAEKARRWAKEDADALAAKVERDGRMLAVRIETVAQKADAVARKADAALVAMTNIIGDSK
jgi:uncharacterized iron-regulated membrane protein